MDRALLAAVSGIDANQTWLDVIGNNIANVNTVGYHSESVNFSDLLTEQVAGATAPVGVATAAGVNPIAIGSGTRVDAVTNSFVAGSMEQTNQPTNVAIQGNGMLVVQQQGLTYYTTAGNLVLDANGNLATPTGALVQGWQANAAGVIDTKAPTTAIAIPEGSTIAPVATTSFTLGGNIPANNGSATQSYSTTIESYDALGNQVPVTLTFTPTTTAGEWSMQGTVPGSTADLWTSPATVKFSTATGQLESVTANGTTYTMSATNPTALPIPVQNMPSNYTFPAGDTWDITFPPAGSTQAVTQVAGADTLTATQNGNGSGTLASYSIGSDGVITGSFSNGQKLALGQIALASFANPQGLDNLGNLLYSTTPNSGVAHVGTPGTGVLGTLVGGSVEESNVDLAKQLTNLIIAQEAYQANTKVVTTSDTAIQSLVNMA